MAFQFRLQILLNVRQNEREQRQRAVAVVRGQLADAIQTHSEWSTQRAEISDSLRILNNSEEWEANQVRQLQLRAEQLATQLRSVKARIAEAETELANRHQELLRADQSVRALERLAERQLAEYVLAQTHTAARDRHEALLSHPRRTNLS